LGRRAHPLSCFVEILKSKRRPWRCPPPPRSIASTYDGLQRLTGATETPGTTYDYTDDLAGNRTDVRENGTLVADLRYTDANQIIGWSYDAAGNLLSDRTTTCSYDALNCLVAQDSTSYTYNGDGVLVSDGTTTSVQDLAAPLHQVLNDGTANYLYGHERLCAVGGSICFIRSSSAYSYDTCLA